MIKFFRAFPLHLKSAFQGLVRHSATAFSAISAVSVTLILMSLFLLLTGNINNFTSNIEGNFKIHASIDSVVVGENVDALKKEVEQIAGVKTVTYSTKDEELRKLKEENEAIFGSYSEGDGNPMRDVFIIETFESYQISEIKDTLDQMEQIVKADYGGDGVTTMVSMFDSIRTGGFIFVAALGLLAIFLISNTIRMTIYARKTEISIMRNVGATNWYIRIPFIIEGMSIGLIGAILPVVLTYFGYSYLYDVLGGHLLSSMFVMKETYPFAAQICAVLGVGGILVGMIGSSMAVSRYLRWKR